MIDSLARSDRQGLEVSDCAARDGLQGIFTDDFKRRSFSDACSIG